MVTAKRRGGGTGALVAEPDDDRLTRPAKHRPQVRDRDLRAALNRQGTAVDEHHPRRPLINRRR